MNINPIFRNYQSRIIYTSIWMLIACIQILVLGLGTEMSTAYAAADSFVFNIIFAFLVIPLWYPVRFNSWGRKTWYYKLTAHFILAGVFIFISLATGYVIIRVFIPANNFYSYFLQSSIWWRIIEGFLLYTLATLVYYQYVYIGQVKEKSENEIRLNKLVKDRELNLLKTQINPHFLFNSLNSVNSMIIKNPEQAQKMIVSLSDYLRHTVISTRQEKLGLQDEIDNIERYLSIEKLRFGDKLIYEFDIDPDCLLLDLPSMLLQPLFENAIKHGVYESLQSVCIMVKINKDNQFLNIIISNDFDAENPIQKKGSGTGLQNIRERLRLLYGISAVLQTKIENRKYIALLKIPINK